MDREHVEAVTANALPQLPRRPPSTVKPLPQEPEFTIPDFAHPKLPLELGIGIGLGSRDDRNRASTPRSSRPSSIAKPIRPVNKAEEAAGFSLVKADVPFDDDTNRPPLPPRRSDSDSTVTQPNHEILIRPVDTSPESGFDPVPAYTTESEYRRGNSALRTEADRISFVSEAPTYHTLDPGQPQGISRSPSVWSGGSEIKVGEDFTVAQRNRLRNVGRSIRRRPLPDSQDLLGTVDEADGGSSGNESDLQRLHSDDDDSDGLPSNGGGTIAPRLQGRVRHTHRLDDARIAIQRETAEIRAQCLEKDAEIERLKDRLNDLTLANQASSAATQSRPPPPPVTVVSEPPPNRAQDENENVSGLRKRNESSPAPPAHGYRDDIDYDEKDPSGQWQGTYFGSPINKAKEDKPAPTIRSRSSITKLWPPDDHANSGGPPGDSQGTTDYDDADPDGFSHYQIELALARSRAEQSRADEAKKNAHDLADARARTAAIRGSNAGRELESDRPTPSHELKAGDEDAILSSSESVVPPPVPEKRSISTLVSGVWDRLKPPSSLEEARSRSSRRGSDSRGSKPRVERQVNRARSQEDMQHSSSPMASHPIPSASRMSQESSSTATTDSHDPYHSADCESADNDSDYEPSEQDPNEPPDGDKIELATLARLVKGAHNKMMRDAYTKSLGPRIRQLRKKLAAKKRAQS